MKRKWKNTGDLIKEYRLKANLSQKDLSNKVVGRSEHGQFFWNIERGKAGLPPKHLFKTSQVLMLPLHTLKEAMIKDYRDNLDEMIKEELNRIPIPTPAATPKPNATAYITLDHHE